MDVMLAKICKQAMAGEVRITQHAQVEMDAEEITLDEVMNYFRQSGLVQCKGGCNEM